MKKAQTKQTIRVITWNVENLFHPETGGPRFDFTEAEGWTLPGYQAKIINVASIIKKLTQINDKTAIPFALTLTEIENKRVADDLLKKLPRRFACTAPPLTDCDYNDSILFYDQSFFNLESAQYHRVFKQFGKGDLLEVKLSLKNSSEKLTLFGCHLKARPPEINHTDMYRRAVCDKLQYLIWQAHNGEEIKNRNQRIKNDDHEKIDSLTLNQNMLVLGDFNDEPFSPSIMNYLCASGNLHYVRKQKCLDKVILYNPAWTRLNDKIAGSLYYDKGIVSKWSMLDQIILSPALVSDKPGLRYLEGSFTIASELFSDSKGRPLPVQFFNEDSNEMEWQDGYSDHFPVFLDLSVD